MIYFDNAATTQMKPPEVVQAVAHALESFGGVGRGVHEASLDAGMTVFRARQALSDLFGGPGAKQVAFASNATEALNVAICGLVHPGDHVVTTAASHNSVLRPLFRAEDAGVIQLSIVPIGPDGSLDYDAFEAAFRSNTRLAVGTHASNLTGDVYDVARMAEIAHAHGALFVVDAAQTAGIVPIGMNAHGIDVVCFTGHIADEHLLAGLYKRALLFLFPSLYDTAGLVVTEAASMGTPSLVVRSSAPAEFITNGETGLLCEENADSLAAAICRALDDPERIAQMGRQAQIQMPRPWETVIDEVEKLYDQIADERRTVGSRGFRRITDRVLDMVGDVKQ